MRWNPAVSLFVSSAALCFLSFFAMPVFAADVSCECAKLTCPPCEEEAGTSFYTEKCGPQNTRVKSCKKTSCQPVEDQKQCLAKLKNGTPVSVARVKGDPEVERVANLAAEAGHITEIQGDFTVTHSNGISEKSRKRDPAFVGDTFETRAESSVKVVLHDGSEIAIAANSKLKIEKVVVEATAQKRLVAMMVLAGRVRNKVTKSYKLENSYQVRTPSAVAGVRGTDFITSYLEGENGWVTEVRTFDGLVRLSSQGAETSKFIDIPPGTYALLHNENGREKLSPLYKIKAEELRQLQMRDFLADAKSTATLPGKRSIASTGATATVAKDEGETICSSPAGAFNQCSFTCEKNPAGEKKCRTDLPNVVCVRRICRANGQWAEPTRLPTSDADHCEAKGFVVKACGQYW